jgi:hypothetical protein
MQVDEKTIKKFCKKPNRETFLTFPRKIQNFFFKTSLYSIENKIGKTDIAQKIINYWMLRDSSKNVIRSLKAIFLALKLFKTPEYKRINPKINIFKINFIKIKCTMNTHL